MLTTFPTAARFLLGCTGKNPIPVASPQRVQVASLPGLAFDPPPRPYGPWATVVFVHGMNHRGPWDPRALRVCMALASEGVRVVSPCLPAVCEARVDEGTIRRIQQVVRAISSATPGEKAPRKVGIFAASFSAAQALRACADPITAARVSGVCAVGSYCDAGSGLRYVLTDPRANLYGRAVLFRNYLRHLTGPCPEIEGALQRWLWSHTTGLWQPGIEERSIPLRQRRLFRNLLDPVESGRVGRYLLPVIVTLDQEAGRHGGPSGSPGPVAHMIPVPVTLVHGKHDDVIQPSESEELHRRLPRSRLTVTPLLSHGDAQPSVLASVFGGPGLAGAFASWLRDLAPT